MNNEEYKAFKHAALVAQVAAVNQANAHANKLKPLLRECFAPFVGQKILRADGSLTVKAQKAFDALGLNTGRERGAWVYRYNSTYSLVFVAKASVSGGTDHRSYTQYHETSVYIGKLTGDTLAELMDTGETFKTDYTAAKIERAREAFQAAQAKADELKSKLFPFGESTR